MTDQEDTAVRSRSPSFPFIPLGKAVGRLETFFSHFQKSPGRVTSAASVWNYQPKSSGLLQTIAALKAYGLIDDEGSGTDRKIRVTDLGFRLLKDQRPGVLEKALKEAALKPAAMKAMWDKWGATPIPDVEVISELHIERGYTEESAKRLLEVYRDTIRYANFNASDIFSEEGASDSTKNQPDNPLPPAQFLKSAEPNMVQDIFNLPEGQLIIQRPQTLSQDSFQELKDWFELVIRRASRSIKTQEGSGDPSGTGGASEGNP